MDARSSVWERVLALSVQTPQRTILTFVDDAGKDQETHSARQLVEAAQGVARLLQRQGLRPGDRAVLCYLPSIDFIKAFVGCLAAGVLPVAVYPPNLFKLELDLPRLAAVLADCGASVVLTHGTYERARTLKVLSGFLSKDKVRWPDIPWVRTDKAAWDGNPLVQPQERVDPDSLAFLQYTSGSTGSPKGVAVTHRNLVDELDSVTVECDVTAGARGVVWAPQYHDMGLIILLSAVVGRIDIHFMSPLAFLKRPAVWFEVMARVGATHTAAPNFALDLAVRKTTPEQRARWNLASLRTLICAAEPIRLATVQHFFAAFSSTGLRADAFYSAYGLAEHTLGISFRRGLRYQWLDKTALANNRAVPLDDADAGDARASYVSCGALRKAAGVVRIVDPDTCVPCPKGQVGEIWVDSSTKAQGYFGREDETSRVFHARVAGEVDPVAYLRTGDLGFLHEGELYVTGRCKDLLILNGRNLYPQDIEETLRTCHAQIRPGGVAAFSSSVAGAERLVVFIELKDEHADAAMLDEVCAAVRRQVFACFLLHCHAVVLGRPGLVQKTTSGKVRRTACREAFDGGQLHQAKPTLKIDLQRSPSTLAA